MNVLLTLCFAFAPQAQAGPVHAGLHPANADFYLEVPDVPSLLSQYERVAMVHSFREESVRGFLGALDMEFELDPPTLFARLLGATLGGADPGDLIQSTRSFSASFAVGEDGRPAITGVVDFTGETEAAEALGWIKSAASTQGEKAAGDFQELRFAEAPETPFWAAVQGSRLLYCGGVVGPAEVLQRTKETSLAPQEDLQRALTSMVPATGATLAWIGIRRSPLEVLGALPESMGGPITQLLEGMRSLPIPMTFLERERWIRMNLDGGRFLTELVTEASAPSSSTARTTVKQEWLATVPSEAMFLYSSGLDGAGLAQGLRALLSIEPGAAQSLARVEQEVGQSIDGLFTNLGPRLVTYAFPLAGIGVPQMYAWAELRDGSTFQARTEGLINGLGERVSGLKASSRDYKVKVPSGERRVFSLTTITLPPEIGQIGGFLSVAPAFAVVDDSVVFSLSSLHLKRELKRLYGDDLPPTDPFSARGLTFPKDPESVLVMDWGKLVAGLFELAKAAGAMAGDFLPFKMSDLPDPEVFTDELRPTLHFSRPTSFGSYRRMESSFGPELVLGLMGLGAEAQQAQAPPAPEEKVAEFEEAAETRQRMTDTASGFRVLRGGLTIYRLEHQRFPDSLSELTQPTDSFPQGFVDSIDVPRDGWDREYRYRTEGEGYVLYSVGANGLDEAGRGDDLRP